MRSIGRYIRASIRRRRAALGLWFRYTFREPLTDRGRANDSLKELCDYRVADKQAARIARIIPCIRRFRFGVWVFVVPVKNGRSWTTCWVRWIADPLELYLVRSAVRGSVDVEKTTPATIHLLESLSPEQMDRLLR